MISSNFRPMRPSDPPGGAIEQAARRCRRLVLIIDGLDEYDRIGQVPVSEWLPHQDALPTNVALIVASRAGAPVGVPAGIRCVNTFVS